MAYLEILMVSVQPCSAEPTTHRHLRATAKAAATARRRLRRAVNPILLLLPLSPPPRRSIPRILLLLLVLRMTQSLLLSERTVPREPFLRSFVSIAVLLFAPFRFFAALLLHGQPALIVIIRGRRRRM